MYGPRDLRFLKLFRAIKKRRFIMLGSGEVTCHLVYIDDLMDGIILCGTQERAIGNIYILGGEGYVTLDRLATMIAEELEVPPPRLHLPLWPVYVAGFLCEALCKPLRIEPPLYRRRIDFFRNSRAFDISKAKRELGFEPKTDLRTGIRLTAAWYRKEGLL
jgi:nucleoside-diphosphate-sugar epimerase